MIYNSNVLLDTHDSMLHYHLWEVDVVYTWVNGSDPIWRESFNHYKSIRVNNTSAEEQPLTKNKTR